jgi:hypothetical protein
VPALLISDANILIDMECGGLLARMFDLSYNLAVPDVLFEQELREHHPELIDLGLHVLSLQPEAIEYTVALVNRYGPHRCRPRRPSGACAGPSGGLPAADR